MPAPQSSSRQALAAVTGPDRPVAAVVDLSAADVRDRLAALAADGSGC
jgi:hypothetical protein